MTNNGLQASFEALLTEIENRIEEKIHVAVEEKVREILSRPLSEILAPTSSSRTHVRSSPAAAAFVSRAPAPARTPTVAKTKGKPAKQVVLSTSFAATPRGRTATPEELHGRSKALIEAVEKAGGSIKGGDLNVAMEKIMAPGTYRALREKLLDGKIIKKEGDKASTVWHLDADRAQKWLVKLAADPKTNGVSHAHAPN